MTFPSHILLGAIIGKLTGDPLLAILVSVLVDIDHLWSYARHGLLAKPKQLWKALTDTADPYGDQRGYLHNIIIAAIISVLTFLISVPFGITFTAAYFGHLLLDALDASDYFIFYPSKKINIKGLITYYSKGEIVFDVVLVVVLILLYLYR